MVIVVVERGLQKKPGVELFDVLTKVLENRKIRKETL